MKTSQAEKMKWEIEWPWKKEVLVNNLTWGKTVYKDKEKVRGHTVNGKLHAELKWTKEAENEQNWKQMQTMSGKEQMWKIIKASDWKNREETKNGQIRSLKSWCRKNGTAIKGLEWHEEINTVFRAQRWVQQKNWTQLRIRRTQTRMLDQV